jgi:hypothetical protein
MPGGLVALRGSVAHPWVTCLCAGLRDVSGVTALGGGLATSTQVGWPLREHLGAALLLGDASGGADGER